MVLLAALVLAVGVLLATLILPYLRSQKQSLITYKITWPLIDNDAAEELSLFRLLRNLLAANKTGWFRPARRLAIEVKSDYINGIEFIISCPADFSATLRSFLSTYWPQLTIDQLKRRDLYKINESSFVKVHQWQVKVSGSQKYDHSLNYLLAGMHGLKASEAAALQIVLSPYQTSLRKLISSWASRMAKLLFWIVGYGLADIDAKRQMRLNRAVKVDGRIDYGFNASIRSLVVAADEKRAKNLDKTLIAAIKSYGLVKRAYGWNHLEGYMERRHIKPVPTTTDELDAIFSFKTVSGIKEDLSHTGAASMPVAIDLKLRHKPDVFLGLNDYSGQITPIGLNLSERQKHLLVIGATGMGKSSLLRYSIIQDMISSKGVGLIDPHGDLAREVLRYLPASRLKDVIYIDPADTSYPVGINLMQLPEGLSDEELEIAKDMVTESIVSIFRKLFSDDDSGGHRIEYILRNVIHTAFNVPEANLFTLNKLLTNDTYRASVVSGLEDSSLKDFWYGEFNKAGSYQRVKMIAGVTAKLGRFQRSVATRRIIEQPHSTINFDEVINNKKILICNFSKGAIGEDTSALLGMMILAKIQLAAWRRSLKQQKLRKPFCLYIDEFQSFASNSLVQLVSESRKYGIIMNLAEQTTAHQTFQDMSILLANIGNLVCFRLSAALDADRLIHLFEPFVNRSSLASLPPYNFYLRMSPDITHEPVSGKTVIALDKGSALIARKAINSSRRLYAKKYIAKKPETTAAESHRVPIKRV